MNPAAPHPPVAPDDASTDLARALVNGDFLVMDLVCFDALNPGSDRTLPCCATAFAFASARTPQPTVLHDLHGDWAAQFREQLTIAATGVYLTSGHDPGCAMAKLTAIERAARNQTNFSQPACDLIDALLDAGMVWLAQRIAWRCHQADGRTHEVAHLIKHVGLMGNDDRWWNDAAATIGLAWSRRPDAQTAAVLSATAARIRRKTTPTQESRTAALRLGRAAWLLDPDFEPLYRCVVDDAQTDEDREIVRSIGATFAVLDHHDLVQGHLPQLLSSIRTLALA